MVIQMFHIIWNIRSISRRWFAGRGGGHHTQNTNYGGDAPDGGGGASGSPNIKSGFGGTPVTANTGSGGGGGGTSNGFVGAGSQLLEFVSLEFPLPICPDN